VEEQIIRQPDVSRNALSFTDEFLFYWNTALSSRGEAGQQMYTRGSIIGGASIICQDISPYLIAHQRSNLSRCGLETEQDVFTIFKLGVQR